MKELNADQARFIALLAKAARAQRDALLGNVAEHDLGGTAASRGEHNPTAEFGLEPIGTDASQTTALREAIASLSEMARRELYTLMRIGQGHVAVRSWHRALSDTQALGTEMIAAALLEDADLHDHLSKALYEAGLAA